MADELKPCPFCGGPARTFVYNGATQASCSGGHLSCAGSDVTAPLAMWNRRTPSAETLAEVQRLREESAERHALHLEQVRITSEWIAERDAALARVEKLREALRMSLEGWENVLELDLLTRSRRHSAKTMATVARAALDEDARHG